MSDSLESLYHQAHDPALLLNSLRLRARIRPHDAGVFLELLLPVERHDVPSLAQAAVELVNETALCSVHDRRVGAEGDAPEQLGIVPELNPVP
jgi:hypothetical protein